MYKEFINDIIDYIKKTKPDKADLSKEKVRLCSKHKLNKIPTDIEILLNASPEQTIHLRKYLLTKPTRTISGVAVAAIMTKPVPCPHGKCTPCPGGINSVFGNVPQSYTGNEPATMRAIRNNFDPYLQVFNRLEQYIVLGQNPDKVELIVMGGTFPSFEKRYQEEFVYFAFKAMNDFSKIFYRKGMLDVFRFKNFFELPGEIGGEARAGRIRKKLLLLKKKSMLPLEEEQKRNENSSIRCVGLTIETRPDYAKKEHAFEMLRLGCTRVELGVQSVYDTALSAINRGHDVKESIDATKRLKDLGFKVNYHMMLGMPGINYIQDLQGLKQLFANPLFRPDMLKIYPCMVIKGTELFTDWQAGKYRPLTTEQAAKMIIEFKRHVPEYVRIMRVQRDIPTKMTEAGVDRTNLRQMIEENMNDQGLKCRCIRCREIRDKIIKGKIETKIIEYEASDGKEYFIALENNDSLLGFCRLRMPSGQARKEITKDSALIRELHVYGAAAKIGGHAKVQHRGFGKRLLQEAERIALKNKKNKMVVISGVGVRGYYRKLGYRKEGPYMTKNHL